MQYLSACLKETPVRVLVALSGGINSAVAAARAVDAGHEVVGVHTTLTRNRAQTRSGSRGRYSIEDLTDARWAAQILGIPFYVRDLSEEFEERVVSDFLDEYRAGRTPNPCVHCNERVKFDALLERALALDFDAVATGHYARLSGGTSSGRPGGPEGLTLHRAVNATKDQSYVLVVSGREGLTRTLFPLRDAPSKAQVRAETEARGLPMVSKPDSYNICFVADGDTRGFLARSLGAHESIMVSPDGEIPGAHQGYFGFTVGQCEGLDLSQPAGDGHPRYVIETHPAANKVVVGPEELLSHIAVDSDGFVLLAAPEPLITGLGTGTTDSDDPPVVDWQEASVQVRAHGRPVPAKVRVDAAQGLLHAELATPLRGMVTGQSLVVYSGDDGSQILAQATVTSAPASSHPAA